MNLKMTTQEFRDMTTAGKKRIFAKFLGNKVNQIVWGGMTNGEIGEYRVRHDECAYSNIKVVQGADGRAELLAYNFRTKQWQTEAF